MQNSGATLFLFGSRARGDHQKFSDLDILVVSKEDPSQLMREISERLEESNFPYKVELVWDQNLAESYRASVERDIILLLQ